MGLKSWFKRLTPQKEITLEVTLEQRVHNLEAGLKRLKEFANNANGQALDARVSTSELRKVVDSHTIQIDALQNHQNALNANFEGILSKLNNVYGDISEINQKLDQLLKAQKSARQVVKKYGTKFKRETQKTPKTPKRVAKMSDKKKK